MSEDSPHIDLRATGPYIENISHAQPGIRVFPGKLYVIAVNSNPRRYRKRNRLYEAFEYHSVSHSAQLITVEAAFGERDFEITESENIWHLQLRTKTEAWHKDNLVNLGIAHLTRLVPDWKYVAWVDADVTFARPDWAQETLHMLQHHKVVQMWSECMDLSEQYSPVEDPSGGERLPGMIYQYWRATERWGRDFGLTIEEIEEVFFGATYDYGYGGERDGEGAKRKRKLHPGHCGYAWAATREAIDALGGLIDFSICGANDHHMAAGLLGDIRRSVNPNCHPRFIEALQVWGERAERYIKPYVGYVNGLILHHWHGPKKRRRYIDRWKILVENQFDPFTDLKRDSQGLYQLSHNKRRLITDLQHYLAQRNEDWPLIQE